ncbi:unnamed protein product, partial [marine sediment metagenome]
LENIDMLLVCLRDMVWFRHSGDPAGAVNADVAAYLAELAGGAPGALAEHWMQLVAAARSDLEANVRMDLVVDGLLLEMDATLRRPSPPLARRSTGT